MSWVTALTVGGTLVSDFFAGRSRASAASQANKAQKAINKANYKRDLELDEIDWLGKNSQYAWGLANQAIAKHQDEVRQADYEYAQDRTISTYVKGLELDMQALDDQYVVGEDLRYLQESMDLDYRDETNTLKLGNAFIDLGIQGGLSELETNQDIATANSTFKTVRGNLRAERRNNVDNARKFRDLQIGLATDQFDKLSESSTSTLLTILEQEDTKYENKVYRENQEFNTIRDNARAAKQQLENAAKNTFATGQDNAVDSRIQKKAELAMKQYETKALGKLEFETGKAQLNVDSQKAYKANERAVAEYMNNIDIRAKQSDVRVAKRENEFASLQEDIVLAEQLDTLKRDAQQVAAILNSADAKAAATARQGGSNSSARLALDALQQFGRSYGQMQVQQKQRRAKLSTMNADTTGALAQEMSAIALQIEGERNRIKYTKQSNDILKKENALKYRDLKTTKGFKDLAASSAYTLGVNSADTQYKGTIRSLATERDNTIARAINTKDSTIRTAGTNKDNAISEAGVSRDQAKGTAQATADERLVRYGIDKRNSVETAIDQGSRNIGNAKLKERLGINTQRNQRDRTVDKLIAKNDLTQFGINQKIGSAISEYEMNSDRIYEVFNDLTLPGFDLASRQGDRDRYSTTLSALNNIDAAATPYREGIFVDPLKPIRGLKPELKKSAKVYVPSTGSIFAQSALNAITAGMEQSYTDPRTGNLKFK